MEVKRERCGQRSKVRSFARTDSSNAEYSASGAVSSADNAHARKEARSQQATMDGSTRGQEDGNTLQQLLRDIRAQGDGEREALEFLSHKLHKKLHEQKLKRMSLDYLREYVARQERDLAAARGECAYGCEVLRK